MINEQDLDDFVRSELRERNILLVDGHWLLGGHLDGRHLCVKEYVRKEKIILYPILLHRYAAMLVGQIPQELLEPDPPLIIGIERGGARLAQAITAFMLPRLQSQARERLMCITAVRTPLRFVFDPREEPYLTRFTRAFIVEDFLVMGRKVRSVVDLIKPCEINVAAILALGERGKVADYEVRGLQRITLLKLAPAVEYEDCLQCAEGIPPTQAPGDVYQKR
ncbi:MAG: hypothetical protein HY566_02725 [Candidatus Kerfeldbacteria bacterium]|nr:hypothetical protein [Candidatus Kerfeldbacteria bacterium]